MSSFLLTFYFELILVLGTVTGIHSAFPTPFQLPLPLASSEPCVRPPSGQSHQSPGAAPAPCLSTEVSVHAASGSFRLRLPLSLGPLGVAHALGTCHGSQSLHGLAVVCCP